MKYLALSIDLTPITEPPTLPKGGLGTIGHDVIQLGLSLFILIGVVLTLAFIMYSGIQWAMSGGEKTKVQAARDRLTHTIIGLLIIILSFVIVRTVFVLLGADPGFFFSLPSIP